MKQNVVAKIYKFWKYLATKIQEQLNFCIQDVHFHNFAKK